MDVQLRLKQLVKCKYLQCVWHTFKLVMMCVMFLHFKPDLKGHSQACEKYTQLDIGQCEYHICN